jgi:hypothetical protein
LARYETQGLDVHATVDLRFVQVLNRAAELSLGPLELESRHDWGHCKKNGCAAVTDTGSIVKITEMVNGGTHGLDVRTQFYDNALRVLAR